MKCPYCGAEVKEDDAFCGECGKSVPRKAVEKSSLGEMIINPVKKYVETIYKKFERVEKEAKEREEINPHLLATILGYIFAFLGGWIGIVFGIYLLTREHPKAKFHGKILLALTAIMIVFWILVIGLSAGAMGV